MEAQDIQLVNMRQMIIGEMVARNARKTPDREAVVVPKPDEELTGEEVIEWCAGHLAGYKKPKHVEIVEALPRNAAMKVVKGELRKQYGKSIRYE